MIRPIKMRSTNLTLIVCVNLLRILRLTRINSLFWQWTKNFYRFRFCLLSSINLVTNRFVRVYIIVVVRQLEKAVLRRRWLYCDKSRKGSSRDQGVVFTVHKHDTWMTQLIKQFLNEKKIWMTVFKLWSVFLVKIMWRHIWTNP